MKFVRRVFWRVMPNFLYRLLRVCEILFVKHGMARTFRTKRAHGPDGEPLPWITYPAIAYLTQLDFTTADVFEFGSGASTLFWQARARSVVSVEDNADWHSEVAPNLADNVTYLLRTDPQAYVRTVEDGEYDVIVVDGAHRRQCVAPLMESLRPGGMVIFDNADWFPDEAAWFRNQGLIEVDFTGFGPINPYTSTTSVFLRRDFDRKPLGDQPVVGIGGLPQNVQRDK